MPTPLTLSAAGSTALTLAARGELAPGLYPSTSLAPGASLLPRADGVGVLNPDGSTVLSLVPR